MKHPWLLAAVIVLFSMASAMATPLPPQELPMYGELEKDEVLKSADAAFIASVEQSGVSRKDGANHAIQTAWKHWNQGDIATAMRRFNQAWLLDPENGNVYHGFARATLERGGESAEVERFYRLAISKSYVAPEVLVDYGAFLWQQSRLDDSLEQLHEALQRSSTTHNARAHVSYVHYLQGDFERACTWAQQAKENGDVLETGYLEDMCQRAKICSKPQAPAHGGTPAARHSTLGRHRHSRPH